MNGWEAESDAAQLLNGLGITTDLHYKQMAELNGSEKVKVLLAPMKIIIRLLRYGPLSKRREKLALKWKLLRQFK